MPKKVQRRVPDGVQVKWELERVAEMPPTPAARVTNAPLLDNLKTNEIRAIDNQRHASSNAPPLPIRASTAIVVLPVFLILDLALATLTVAISAGLAADPEPASKIALLLADISLAAIDIYTAFQHINYAHWVVSGEPIRKLDDLKDWTPRP